MTKILVLACVVYGSLLVAAVYFTRATTRRVLGSLAGGISVALVARVEAVAHGREVGGGIRPMTRRTGRWPSILYSS